MKINSRCAWCQPMTEKEMQDNPNVSHEICPRCLKIMEEEFREYQYHHKKIEGEASHEGMV